MIEFRDVSKSFPTKTGRKTVIEQASFVMEKGANYGILGKNGAGKSTLLRMISGVETPDSGEIVRRASVSWPIAFSGFLHGSLTGCENARFVARIYGEPPDRIERYTRDFADIGSYFDMPTKTYSSGMRARLAFALSLAIDFDVQLIDEIMAVGDSDFQKKCHDAMLERSQRSTFIIVAHQAQILEKWCHVGAYLENGKLNFYDDIKKAIHVYKGIKATG